MVHSLFLLNALRRNFIKKRLQLANQYFQNKQFHQARLLTVELFEEQPHHPETLFALANIKIHFEEYDSAIPLLKQCRKSIPKQIQPLLLLAKCYSEVQNLSAAEKAYKTALNFSAEDSNIHFLYAGCLNSFGKQQKTQFHLHKVLEINPQHTAAMLALSEHMDFSITNTLYPKMTSLLLQLNTSRQTDSDPKSNMDIMRLHFALGKAGDDRGDFDSAFEHWQRANELQFELCSFKTSEMLPFVQALIENFNSALCGAVNNQNKTQPYPVPIFIVGLPRSGSTLLESLLLKDPDMGSIGELNLFEKELVPVIEEFTGEPYPFAVAKLNTLQIEQLGNLYLQKISNRQPKKSIIIDKLPANFQSIGLIKLILPNAKIIHLSRAREAIALSIYRNYFAANEPYFCNLNEFEEYYKFYIKLMKHWYQISQIEIFEVSYEELITTQQKVIDAIRLYLGRSIIPVSEKNSPRTGKVNTLSVNQVRKPIYKTAKDHWKNYSKFLNLD